MKKMKQFKNLFLYIYSCLLISSTIANADQKMIKCFQDLDHDGFGDANIFITNEKDKCSSKYVTNDLDCNDNPKNSGLIFHPGAKEPCNYEDYNCDHQVEKCQEAPLGAKVNRATDALVISSFQKHHPFKTSATGTHNLNDNTDVYPGMGTTQSAMIQTDGVQSPKVLRAIGLGPYDLTNKMPRLWIKLQGISHLNDFAFYLGNNKFTNYAVFNLVSTQGQKWITEGDWVSPIFSWNPSTVRAKLEAGMTLEDLKRNITDVQIKITDDGQAPVKLKVNRISVVAEPRKKYPHGVISVTFDDNWSSQYLYAFPKLAEYNFPATAYVIVGFLDTPNYMKTSELKQLHDKYKWEIGFHAFDPVMHLAGMTTYPAEVVERDILAGRQWLWQNGLGDLKNNNLSHFAYPKGEFLRPGLTDVVSIARKIFSSARSISEKHHEVLPPADTYKLRVLYVSAPETAESVIENIEKSTKAGEWVILVFHDFVTFPPIRNDQWEVDKFNKVIDYLGAQKDKTPVLSIGEVLNSGP